MKLTKDSIRKEFPMIERELNEFPDVRVWDNKQELVIYLLLDISERLERLEKSYYSANGTNNTNNERCD